MTTVCIPCNKLLLPRSGPVTFNNNCILFDVIISSLLPFPLRQFSSAKQTQYMPAGHEVGGGLAPEMLTERAVPAPFRQRADCGCHAVTGRHTERAKRVTGAAEALIHGRKGRESAEGRPEFEPCLRNGHRNFDIFCGEVGGFGRRPTNAKNLSLWVRSRRNKLTGVLTEVLCVWITGYGFYYLMTQLEDQWALVILFLHG